MITVGIIGLLAAIAIPGYLRFQLKSKVTEASTNLRAIAKAESAYFAEHSHYVSVNVPVPNRIPDNRKAGWTGGTGFDALGWSPEGAVYFQYRVGADDGGAAASPRFTAESRGDVDADGTFSYFALVRPSAGQAAGLPGALPGTTCLATGVYAQGGGSNVLNVPGPCDAASGQSEF
ncbi:MAG: type IV pilin protein [Myxococcota bacterium]